MGLWCTSDRVAPERGHVANPMNPWHLPALQLEEDQAQIVTLGEPPYSIIDVNKKWLELCEFSREEVIGKTQKLL